MRPTLLTAALLLGATNAWADKPEHHGLLHPGMLDAAAKRIGLDDSTLARIKDKIYESEKAKIPIKGELKAARLDLRRALDTDNPDRGEVMRIADQIGRVEVKLEKHRLSLLLDVRAMLTPEQREKLQTMRHELREERRIHRRDRKGWGPPEVPQPPSPPQPPR